jgi:hypothetical protein
LIFLDIVITASVRIGRHALIRCIRQMRRLPFLVIAGLNDGVDQAISIVRGGAGAIAELLRRSGDIACRYSATMIVVFIKKARAASAARAYLMQEQIS